MNHVSSKLLWVERLLCLIVGLALCGIGSGFASPSLTHVPLLSTREPSSLPRRHPSHYHPGHRQARQVLRCTNPNKDHQQHENETDQKESDGGSLDQDDGRGPAADDDNPYWDYDETLDQDSKFPRPLQQFDLITDVPEDVRLEADSNAPSKLEGMMIIMGITPVSVAMFSTSLVILFLNAVLGTGWLGDALHLRDTETRESFTFPVIRLDKADNLL